MLLGSLLRTKNNIYDEGFSSIYVSIMVEMSETPQVGEKPKYELRSFVLRDGEGHETSTFTGVLPRQAALKAASRFGGTKEQPVELYLRERRTRKVHVFSAWKELVDAPETRPSWLPAQINRSFVKKIRVIHLDIEKMRAQKIVDKNAKKERTAKRAAAKKARIVKQNADRRAAKKERALKRAAAKKEAKKAAKQAATKKKVTQPAV